MENIILKLEIPIILNVGDTCQILVKTAEAAHGSEPPPLHRRRLRSIKVDTFNFPIICYDVGQFSNVKTNPVILFCKHIRLFCGQLFRIDPQIWVVDENPYRAASGLLKVACHLWWRVELELLNRAVYFCKEWLMWSSVESAPFNIFIVSQCIQTTRLWQWQSCISMILINVSCSQKSIHTDEENQFFEAVNDSQQLCQYADLSWVRVKTCFFFYSDFCPLQVP